MPDPEGVGPRYVLRSLPRPAPPPGPWLVAGMGRAGTAAVEALESFGGASTVRAWDEAFTRATVAAASAFERRGIRATLGGDGVGSLDAQIRSVVKAPGIRADAPVLAAARQRGLSVMDEFELGWRLSSAPLVAVTGTNGKSTTAMLLVEALAAAGGSRPPLAGNTDFGPPLSSIPPTTDGPVVAEVSSYQLEWTEDT